MVSRYPTLIGMLSDDVVNIGVYIEGGHIVWIV